MSETFHYPPEFFELLVDTIPLLCRTKKAVVLFFRGAGVGFDVIADLGERVEANHKAISKYEIARSVLARVNEQGDAGIKVRREIVKRVTEFEDFFTCWPDDQLKAKGCVAEVRRILNIKDSFTRMKDEREKERQKHIAEHNKKVQAAQEHRRQLTEIKDQLFSLFAVKDVHKRGKSLENVLNRLFRTYNVLIHSDFKYLGDQGEGIIDQIDGVIKIDGHLYLVEMKWWQHPLGKAEISPHLVNIFSRDHAGGIIISASTYTQPAVTVCKEALPLKVVVLCELEEIVMLLEKERDLQEFLRAKIDAAIVGKNPFLKPLE